MSLDATRRFSNRADDYVRYRPGYPAAIVGVLREECGLTPDAVIADVGSGTGILTRLFLENGNLVYGVEPNADMRAAGEQFLRGFPRFRSLSGSAEATTLANGSVDFVTAGQAFHWFDLTAARAEFERILRPDGWVAIIANERLRDQAPIQRQYEELIRKYGTDYEKVADTYPKYALMDQFFGPGNHRAKSFPNVQVFDFAGLRGRLLSASYAPSEGHPNHQPMLAQLKEIFDANAQDGTVHFDYKTHLQYGQLRPR